MTDFDLQPTLKGNLLRLRPLKPEDFEALFAVSSDPLIWEMHPEKNRYQRDVFEKFFAAAIESRGAFAAIDSQSGEVIGSSRFTAFNPEKKSIEVGYTFLARKCWGKGYNREMKTLMLNHAFRFVENVFFYIGEKNHRSRRAIEKIGARLLEMRERQPREGAQYFSAVYGLSKSDFVI